jgi:hypothetical protein
MTAIIIKFLIIVAAIALIVIAIVNFKADMPLGLGCAILASALCRLGMLIKVK